MIGHSATSDIEQFDVIIIGTGSGNSLLTPDYDRLKVALIERDVFGGTCLNRGCIPTKMFVYPADIARQASTASKLGIDISFDRARWTDIRDRVFGRIDPIPPAGKHYRQQAANITVFDGEAHFVGPRLVEVNGQLLNGGDVIIATGARPMIPAIDGLAEIGYHTSDSIMRIDALPARLVILGGGFIAAEFAHVFGAFGTKVSLIARGSRLLSHEDEEIGAAFTTAAQARFDVHLSTRVRQVSQAPNGEITLKVEHRGETTTLIGDALLVATGRVPNNDVLNVAAAGVEVDDAGYVVTDQYLRTTAPGIWALGDASNHHQLKHVANAEARIVAHNVVRADALRAAHLGPIPHAVFTDPQIGAVGATEQELRAAGRDYVTAVQHYGDIAYGWAMEDTTNFCKLIADPHTRLLLGAHVIGQHAATLVQQLIQGMNHGLTVDQMAREQLYIHPAMPELIENALLQF